MRKRSRPISLVGLGAIVAVLIIAGCVDVVHLTLDAPLTVILTSPTRDATGVPLESTIYATLSKPIKAGSEEGRFLLWDGTTSIDGTVSVLDSSTLSFVPARRLRGLGVLRAEIDSQIESTDNVALGEAYEWTFLTSDFEWTIPIAVSNTSLDASNGRIAVDSSGNALIVYGQFDGTRQNLVSRRYDEVTATWSSAAFLEFNDAALLWFDADMNASGTAVAVWLQQNGGGNHDLFGARFSSVSGWGTPQPLEGGSANISDYPAVSVAPDGSAIVVWLQSDGTRKNVWANHMNPTGSWDGAVLIETDPGEAISCEVAVAPDGSAIATWSQVGTTINIWSNRYAASTWEQATLVETIDTGNAGNPQIVIDGNGDATIVWQQCAGSCFNFVDAVARRRMANGSWDAVVYLEASAEIVSNLKVSGSRNGHVLAMWNAGQNSPALWAARYIPPTGWLAPQLVTTTGWSHSMAIDDYDHAAAVWGTNTASSISRFDGISWSTRPLEETASVINGYMAMTPRGEAAVVWTRYESYLVPYRVNAGLLR